ncbi:MAG: LptA/OstA family protein [Deltaproteobacteria bacterium]|nr:LptA/OstA family protein [Deltaproteobacteria bacterium]
MPTLQHFISTPGRSRWLWITALVAVAALMPIAARAADDSKTAQADNEPIQIVADELISFNEEKYAEFIGNVIVTQGEFKITSDKLRIYYRGEILGAEKKESEKKESKEDVIKKIIATGNVTITSEQYEAQADKAEYDTATMTVVLSGENSKVVSGKNSISGSVIRLNQKSGQVKVESSATKRIKAEFFTKGKTSDAFKIDKPEE